MYKIGLSSRSFSLTEENFIKLHEAGIEATEIAGKAELYADLDYKKIQDYSKRYSVELWSYHLPYMPFGEVDPSLQDSDKRKKTVTYFSELIKKGSDIGIDKFIVHPSGEPVLDGEREERIKLCMESLDTLANVASECGAYIAVEDLPRTCLGRSIEEMHTLISANEKLRVCFDTNHLLTDNNLKFMDELADRIVTVHVSDYDFVDEKHWLPGEGKNDWKAIFEKFREINYNGVWMCELALCDTHTIRRERDIGFSDVVKNAKSIFDGRKPYTISHTVLV